MSDASGAGPRTAYLSLGLLTVTYVFAYADRFAMAMLLQPIKTDLRLSDATLGLLTGFAFAAFYAAAGIPLGRMADRVNRKTLLATSLTAWSIATAACGVAGSWLQLALARMAVGVGEAGCAPASHSLISDLFQPGRRALPLAIFTSGGTLGMVGGFAIGAELEARLGWRGTFAALGGAGLVFVPVLALMLPKVPRDTRTEREAPARLLDLFRTRGFVSLTLAISFVTLGLLGLTQWLPAFYERTFGLSRIAIGGTLATVNGLGSFVGLLGGGWLADWGARRHPRWPLRQFVLSTTLVVPLQLAMLLAASPSVSFTLAFLTMLVGMAGTGPALAVVQTIVPPRTRATATATLLVGSALIGTGGGPFIAGALSDALQPTLQVDSLRWSLATVAAAAGAIATLLACLATTASAPRTDKST